MFQSVWGDDCDRRDSFFFVRVRRFRDSPNLFSALFVCWFSLFLWFCLFFGNSRPKNRFLHSIGSSMATTTKKKRNKKIIFFSVSRFGVKRNEFLLLSLLLCFHHHHLLLLSSSFLEQPTGGRRADCKRKSLSSTAEWTLKLIQFPFNSNGTEPNLT